MEAKAKAEAEAKSEAEAVAASASEEARLLGAFLLSTRLFSGCYATQSADPDYGQSTIRDGRKLGAHDNPCLA